MFLLSTYYFYAQELDIQQKISVEFKNLSVEEAIIKLQNEHNLLFAYTSFTVDYDKKINQHFINETLSNILNHIFKNTYIQYTVYSNQIILVREKVFKENFSITGIILDKDSLSPIEYATVSIPSKAKGTIANNRGEFEFELSAENLNDTLKFSFLGYKPFIVVVEDYINENIRIVQLQQEPVKISQIKVSPKDYITHKIGNKKRRSKGSLYMDTHGQQAALFIENEDDINGIIKSIAFYLSKEGNTDAPFRIRIYSKDSVSGAPGQDLLKDILVVKPEIRKGWFKINIRSLNIKVPENGFFIAIEGIYPNDYDFYYDDGGFKNISIQEDNIEFDDGSFNISYGQRIGYTKNKKNVHNTWHFSMSNTWFQLKKQQYGIMIYAEIIERKTN